MIGITPTLALIVCLTLGIIYVLTYKFIRKFLSRIGKERVIANQLRFTAVSEAFGASKEVKIGGLEKNYVKRFSDPAKSYAKQNASAQVISQNLKKVGIKATVRTYDFGAWMVRMQQGDFDMSSKSLSESK